jgi:hypothetical protein
MKSSFPEQFDPLLVEIRWYQEGIFAAQASLGL